MPILGRPLHTSQLSIEFSFRLGTPQKTEIFGGIPPLTARSNLLLFEVPPEWSGDSKVTPFCLLFILPAGRLSFGKVCLAE